MSDRSSLLTPLAPLLAPRGLYLTGEDYLRVTSRASIASVAIVISGRTVDERGKPIPFSDRHVAASDRTETTTTIRLGCGWLTDVSAIVTGASPQLGQAFVRVDLIRGDGTAAHVLATLIQGALNAGQRLGWPGSPLETTLERGGAIRSIAGSNPAANTEIVETVPAGARWRLQSIRFALTTDATAANREVAITFDDGTTVYAEAHSGANQAASLTRQYTAARVGVRGAAATGTGILIAIPDLVLPAGHRISTATTNRQATDDFGAPQLLVEEWLEGA